MRSKAKRWQKFKEREVVKAFQEGQWRLFLQQGQCSQVENIWAGKQMTTHPSSAAHWHFEQMPFPPWRTFCELMVCGRTAHPGNVELKSKNCTPHIPVHQFWGLQAPSDCGGLFSCRLCCWKRHWPAEPNIWPLGNHSKWIQWHSSLCTHRDAWPTPVRAKTPDTGDENKVWPLGGTLPKNDQLASLEDDYSSGPQLQKKISS